MLLEASCGKFPVPAPAYSKAALDQGDTRRKSLRGSQRRRDALSRHPGLDPGSMNTVLRNLVPRCSWMPDQVRHDEFGRATPPLLRHSGLDPESMNTGQ